MADYSQTQPAQRIREAGGTDLPVGAVAANQLLMRGAASSIAGAYGLSLIERKVVSVAAASATFSGLTGDTDRNYLLLYRATCTQGASLYFQPNAATTNLSWTYIHHAGAAPTGGKGDADANGTLFSTGPNTAGENGVMSGWAIFNASTGKMRQHTGMFTATSATTVTDHKAGSVFGFWNETATAITSLKIFCDGGASSLVNGTFSLYRIIDGT